MNRKMSKISLRENRRKVLTKLITEMGAKIRDDDYIIIKKNDLLFKIYFWGNLVHVRFDNCDKCELDCNKDVHIEINSKLELWNDFDDLKKEDISRLSKIYSLITDNEDINYDEIKAHLTEQLKRIKFIMLGFNNEENSKIFKEINGSKFDIPFLKDTQSKIIETFPQLLIEMCNFSEIVMENFTSNRPAPILIDFLKDLYGFLIISDSTSSDITKIKTKLLPNIYKYNPFALCLIIGLHYGEKNHLSPELMENILNRKTYGLSDEETIQSFMEILYQSVLLRIDQMKKLNCIFIEDIID